MSFFIYDLSFLILFGVFVILFLIKRKDKLKREGLLFLYRTKIGLKVINYVGEKYKRALKLLSYLIVSLGYILMIVMIYLLVELIKIFSNPDYVKIIKIPPIIPLIPYLPKIFNISWLPDFYFTYFIISIAIVAIVHEGFHGILARYNKIRIKSTGFGFLGPFLAFFVEQNDKDMKKAKIFPQLSVLGAGVFANIVAGIIFFFIMMSFFHLAYAPQGSIFNDYTYSVVNINEIKNITLLSDRIQVDSMNFSQIYLNNKTYFIWEGYLNENLEGNVNIKLYEDQSAIRQGIKGVIKKINDKTIKNNNDIKEELTKFEPGDNISLETKFDSEILDYNIQLGKSYESERAVIGIAYVSSQSSGIKGFLFKLTTLFKDPNIYYEAKISPDFMTFIYNLFWWIVLINFSVALVNMLPLGIFDGGRFFYLTILKITKSEKIAKYSFKFSTYFILLVFLYITVLWFINFFW